VLRLNQVHLTIYFFEWALTIFQKLAFSQLTCWWILQAGSKHKHCIHQ